MINRPSPLLRLLCPKPMTDSSLQASLMATLRADLEMLEGCKTRLALARTERENAALELDLAQARLVSATAREAQLDDHQRILSAALDESRAAYSREILARMPEDVLRCIMEMVVHGVDGEEDFGSNKNDTARALAPFVLSRVSSKWRRVCCASPRLWAYIGVPDLDTRGAQHCARVELHLSRSKAVDLDIIVSWSSAKIRQFAADGSLLVSDDDDDDDIDEDDYDADITHGRSFNMRRIFSLLANHAVRWRQVEFWLPRMPNRDLLGVFKTSMPRLLALCMVALTADKWNFSPLGSYFPHVPRLQTLDLASLGIFPSARTASFSSIRSFRIWEESSSEHILRFLGAIQPTVEDVIVDIANPVTPSVPFNFPMLTSLGIRDAMPTKPHFFVAARLTHLSLHVCALSSVDVAAFLDHVATTVTQVTVTGSVTKSHLVGLRRLHRVDYFCVKGLKS